MRTQSSGFNLQIDIHYEDIGDESSAQITSNRAPRS